MWRYLAGGVAALLMVAAGWMLFSTRATTDPIIPPAPSPPTAAQRIAREGAADAPVPEASERTREEKRFDRYDKDRNDSITREEYLASRRKAFAKLDTNGDGRLSFDEWAAKTTAKFASADRDKSGAMDRAEFATTAVKRKTPLRSARKPECPPVRSADDDS